MAKLRTSLLLLISVTFTPNYSAILGPGFGTFQDAENCPGTAYTSYLALTASKVNRTHQGITLEANFDFDIVQPTSMVHINVAKWGDGGYKPNFYIMDDEVCKVFEMFFKETGKEVLELATGKTSCPINKGKYRVENYVMDQNKLPEQMMYGKYKTTIMADHYGVEKLCVIVFSEITPRNN